MLNFYHIDIQPIGGGTGSGVGSYIVSMLEDLYPEVYRFSTCVFPTEDDDVVTSPYNAILAAVCTFDICVKIYPRLVIGFCSCIEGAL